MRHHLDQFERAHRYLGRLRELYKGERSDKRSLGECEDDTFSFFVHCYHVRDWIVHLNRVGATAKDVDAFIDKHDCLKLCADLCNGAKHCRLTRASRSGVGPHLAMKEYRYSTWLTGDAGLEIVQGKYTVLAGNSRFDALSLAEDCMNCWGEYMRELSNSLGADDLPEEVARASFLAP